MPVKLTNPAEYGDKKLLGQFAVKNDPAAVGPQLVNARGGRPRSQSVAMARPAPPAQPEAIPAEHDSAIQRGVMLQRGADLWMQIAANPQAGPVIRRYAQMVYQAWMAEHTQPGGARAQTPFFRGI